VISRHLDQRARTARTRRSVEETCAVREDGSGGFKEGEDCLRAMIVMASSFIVMRDSVIYASSAESPSDW
jgi:hypothetical protein